MGGAELVLEMWGLGEEGDDDAITLQPEGTLMERPEEPEEETICSS